MALKVSDYTHATELIGACSKYLPSGDGRCPPGPQYFCKLPVAEPTTLYDILIDVLGRVRLVMCVMRSIRPPQRKSWLCRLLRRHPCSPTTYHIVVEAINPVISILRVLRLPLRSAGSILYFRLSICWDDDKKMYGRGISYVTKSLCFKLRIYLGTYRLQ